MFLFTVGVSKYLCVTVVLIYLGPHKLGNLGPNTNKTWRPIKAEVLPQLNNTQGSQLPIDETSVVRTHHSPADQIEPHQWASSPGGDNSGEDLLGPVFGTALPK